MMHSHSDGKRHFLQFGKVLILVVMDDALAQRKKVHAKNI